MHVLDKNTGRS